LPWYRDYILGALGNTAACLVTNPFEVVKTRLQLQGELALSAAKPYKGVAHAFVTIIKHEGITAIQKGLFPACCYQFTMNGIRLGTFSVLQHVFGTRNPDGSQPNYAFIRNLCAGGLAGATGAFFGSPFFLVKIRMQSQSDYVQIGQQYKYKSTLHAFRGVWNEGGIKSLMRGVDAAVIRVAMGSSVQLSTYEFIKKLVASTGLEGKPANVAGSFAASFMVVLAMNPMDVVTTRMMNDKTQGGQGTLYKGPLDCLIKTVRAEGIRGIYKGAVAHYFRIGPHTVLGFFLWEEFRLLSDKLGLLQ